MVTTLRRSAVRWSLVLCVLAVFAGRAAPAQPTTGTVNLDTSATFTGTGTGPSLDPDLQGTHKDDGVFATFTIYTIVQNGKTVVDPAQKSTVTFTNSNFKTQSIPVTGVSTDSSGNVTGFTFTGTDWYDPNGKGAADVVSTGLSGAITLDPKNPKKAKGALTASYKSKDGKTVQNISFTTTPIKPVQTKPSKPGAPLISTSQISPEESVDYNAATGVLSISHDTITQTPFANDPLVGAAVTFPNFTFEGLSTDGSVAIFWPTDTTPYTIAQGSEVLQQSIIPFLYYDTASNQFYSGLSNITLAGVSADSPFFDPALPNVSSPFLSALAGILDPLSPDFDPLTNLYVGVTPDLNFLAITNDFTSSGSSGATDVEFAADPVPEPGTFVLAVTGIGGLVVCASYRRGRVAHV